MREICFPGIRFIFKTKRYVFFLVILVFASFTIAHFNVNTKVHRKVIIVFRRVQNF